MDNLSVNFNAQTDRLMKKILFFVITILANSLAGNAQDTNFAFRVLANKGDNKVEKQNGDIVALKSRDLLYETDILITSDGAYLGLMHSSGKAQEVKGKQKVAVADLIVNVSGQQLSSLSKYAQMISKRLAEGEADKKVSVGTRAVGSKIEVMMPQENELYGSKAVVKFKSTDKAPATYEVVILDILDEVVYSAETSSDSVLVDFSTVENDMGLYVLNVRKKSDATFASANYPIRHLSGDEYDVITNDLEPLTAGLSEDSPLNLLIIASFFDDNELFLDAQYNYERAIALSPDIPEYKELYQIFLESYGLNK